MERVGNYRIFFGFFALIFGLVAFASPTGTTYQAHIIKPDGQALEANNVNFKFSILNPAGSCVVYSETYSAINMANTSGMISFTLGSGVKSYPASGVTFADVFNNSTANLSCDVGGPVNYSPASTDVRKIIMQFNDGAGWQTLPAMSINAVPYSIYSNDSLRLGGVSATSYVQYSTIPTCTASSQALQYNGSSFSCATIAGSGGASGTVTSTDVTNALGYTPANQSTVGTSFTSVANSLTTVGTSFSTVTSSINSLGTSVTAVSTSVASLSTSLTALTATVNAHTASLTSLASTVTAHTASLAAITSSQWLTTGNKISYNSGNVGIGTSAPVTRLEIANGNGALTGNFDAFSISAYNVDWGYPVSATIGLTKTTYGNSWGEAMEFKYTSPDPGVLPPQYIFRGSSNTSDVVFEDGRVMGRQYYANDYIYVSRANTNNAAYYAFLPSANYTNYDFMQALSSAGALYSVGSVSAAGAVTGYYTNVTSGSYQIRTSNVNRLTVVSGGAVGIGTATPATALDVSGGVRIGTENSSCAAGLAGTLRYNSGNVEYCNGSTWQAFGTGGAITSSSIVAALAYTPANSATIGASVTANTNSISTLTTSYTTINNSVNTVTTSLTALTTSYAGLAASMSALAAGGGSQWTTTGSNISYSAGNVGIKTTNPQTPFSVGDSLWTQDWQLTDIASATTAEFNVVQTMTSGQKSAVTINSVASTTIQSLGIDVGLTVDQRVSPLQDIATPIGNRVGVMAMNQNTTLAPAGQLYGGFNILGNTGGATTGALVGDASIIMNTSGTTNVAVADMNQLVNMDNMIQAIGSYGIMQNMGTVNMFRGVDYGIANLKTATDMRGVSMHIQNSGSTTVLFGIQADITNQSSGFAQAVYGIHSQIDNYSGASMTSVYGLYLEKNMSTPAVNDYGIFQVDPSKNYFAGRIGIGTSSPVTALEVSGGVRIGTENATCAVSYAGTLRYMASNVEYCNGSAWQAFSTGGVTSSSIITALGYTPANSATVKWATSGTTLNYLSGNVGIGTATPTTKLSVVETTAADVAMSLSRPAGQQGIFAYATGLSPRWMTYVTSEAETGSNAGSNFGISRWSDAGTFLGNALFIKRDTGNISMSGDLSISGVITSAGDLVPASSTLLMNTCPSGWTDLGLAAAAGPGAVTCNGTTCHMCNTAVATTIPSSSQILMESCPSGWTNLGRATGPGGAAYIAGPLQIPLVTCQSPSTNSILPKGLRLLAPSCPTGWNDIAATGSGPNIANCPSSSCRVCEIPNGNAYQRMLYGGDASGTSAYGSDAFVMGGKGGTSGYGGSANVYGGSAIDGGGGAVNIFGGAASGTSSGYLGGNVTINGGGSNISSGSAGSVYINGGLNTGNNNYGNVNIAYNGGLVGVGTNAPQAKLDVKSSTNIGSLVPTNISAFASGGIRITNDIPGAVTEALTFGSPSTVSGAGAAIAFRRESTQSYIDFYTNSGSDLTDGAIRRVVTINRNGYLGIGTSDPTTPLHTVEKNATTTTPVAVLETTGTNARPYLQFKAENDVKGYVGYGSTGNDSLVLMNYKQAPLIIGVSSTTGILIDANGRTAVGKASASEILDVGGNINVGANDAGPNYIAFHGTNGDGPNAYNHTYIGERIYAAGESSELLLFKGNDSDNISGPDRIRLVGGNLVFDTYSSPNAVQGSFESIATSVSVTTKMIIKGNGMVGIGNTNPAATLDVTGDIRGTGTVATWSDVRAKKDIKVIPDALNKILQLRGVGFNWRVDEFPEKKFKTTPDIGVIAQEVEKVFPEVVKTNDDGFKSVGYAQLVAPLIEAVKELYYKITGVERKVDRVVASVENKADKSEVEKLKAENVELKQRLDRLEKMMQQNQKTK